MSFKSDRRDWEIRATAFARSVTSETRTEWDAARMVARHAEDAYWSAHSAALDQYAREHPRPTLEQCVALKEAK